MTPEQQVDDATQNEGVLSLVATTIGVLRVLGILVAIGIVKLIVIAAILAVIAVASLAFRTS
jgi:hypothetical protein